MLKQQLCYLTLFVLGTWMLPVKRGCGVYSSADPTLSIWKPPELLRLICVSTQCSLPCPAILCASCSSLCCLFHIHLYFTAVQWLWNPYGQHCLCVPAWNLILSCNSKMPIQEQMGIRGTTQQVGCQTPCLSPTSVLSLCHFSLHSSGLGGTAGLGWEQCWQNSATNTESLH